MGHEVAVSARHLQLLRYFENSFAELETNVGNASFRVCHELIRRDKYGIVSLIVAGSLFHASRHRQVFLLAFC